MRRRRSIIIAGRELVTLGEDPIVLGDTAAWLARAVASSVAKSPLASRRRAEQHGFRCEAGTECHGATACSGRHPLAHHGFEHEHHRR
jgi:hypothetical protein